ncbi:hypothetical protein Q5P01_023504 [Channa striata]|uniref:Clarin 3 n=1 Tax=Channa striata TaxID=64152 RepID=A0AA88IUZ1_CHASR|nr:hypothetical protein Q5P01_023504 [Channa striata]
MPSVQKSLFFISSALVTAKAVGVLGYAMSTQWAIMTMKCVGGGSGSFNGSATITLALFNGKLDKVQCPFGNSDNFQVFPELVKIGGSPVALHGLVLCLLVLCLLFSAGTILISLYNSVSNPYETYMGPIGIYTCSSLSACLSFVVLIIFVASVTVTSMAEDMVKNSDQTVELDDKSTEMQLGYYLVIPYTVLSLAAIALIFMYDHAAYTHRREQQRPTEEAPKEIMMY